MNYSQWFHDQLRVGADGLAWSIEQVPAERRYVKPPAGLGEWSVARHVFHMLYYEQTIALPSMYQWLGSVIPTTEDAAEEIAWADNDDRIEDLLVKFRTVRSEQIALLPKFSDPLWQEACETVWGSVTLLWVVSKTFQHTAEHTSDVMQMSLWWDEFLAG